MGLNLTRNYICDNALVAKYENFIGVKAYSVTGTDTNLRNTFINLYFTSKNSYF